jgi:WD40 repeat protein
MKLIGLMTKYIFFSLSDDNTIIKWDPNSLDSSKLFDLDSFATDIDFLPGTRGINDVIAISFADGSFRI